MNKTIIHNLVLGLSASMLAACVVVTSVGGLGGKELEKRTTSLFGPGVFLGLIPPPR